MPKSPGRGCQPNVATLERSTETPQRVRRKKERQLQIIQPSSVCAFICFQCCSDVFVYAILYNILGSASTYTLASRRNPLSRTPIFIYNLVLAMSDRMSDGAWPVLDTIYIYIQCQCWSTHVVHCRVVSTCQRDADFSKKWQLIGRVAKHCFDIALEYST